MNMKTRSNLKNINWQDVTIELLNSHWGGMCDLSGFELACYQNAFAYGDICGDGIDVRCQHADEVVSIYLENLKANDIKMELQNHDWMLVRYDKFFLEMHKENDIVMFNICDNDEAGYMTMTITNEYADECSSDIEDFYEQMGIDVQYNDEIIAVNETNIEGAFKFICFKNINLTEDAGCGMRNLMLSNGDIIQVYPYTDDFTYIIQYHGKDEDGNGINEDICLKDLSFDDKVMYLKQYINMFSKIIEKKNQDKNCEVIKKFIECCTDCGANYCNESEDEIIWADRFGNVYIFNKHDSTAEMKILDKPSMLDTTIHSRIISKFLANGKYKEIVEYAKFLEMTMAEKDKNGVPFDEIYYWVWLENPTNYKTTKISFEDTQFKKDCEYLKSIYPLLKDAYHVDIDGTINTTLSTEEMVGNAEQFCSYFKDSGLSLDDFLKHYDKEMIDCSLYAKCYEYAENLVGNYTEKLFTDKVHEIANDMYKSMRKIGAKHFPIKK